MSRVAPTWLAWVVVAMYLAATSSQAIAATVDAIACQAETAVGAAQASNHHLQMGAKPDKQGSMALGDTPERDASDTDSGGHLCCQLVVVALPSRAGSAEPRPLAFLPSTPDVSHYVTFLERFERPPLARAFSARR